MILKRFSKTLAEKAAWEFAKEKGLDVVVVNPGTVMGPVIPPTLNASMLMLLRFLQGNAPLPISSAYEFVTP